MPVTSEGIIMRPLTTPLRLGGTRSGGGAIGRRTVLTGGAAGLLGLTACGGSGTSTRTVDTAHGPVKVPVSPKRVVTASAGVASYMWDVGVDPVGVYELDDVDSRTRTTRS